MLLGLMVNTPFKHFIFYKSYHLKSNIVYSVPFITTANAVVNYGTLFMIFTNDPFRHLVHKTTAPQSFAGPYFVLCIAPNDNKSYL